MTGDYTYALVIDQLSRQIELSINKTLEQVGITKSQVAILIFLHEQEASAHCDVFQKDIEKAFMLSNPAVSGILQRLECKQLIEKKVLLSDCRHKQISLTESSRELIKQLRTFRADYEQTLLMGIDAQERDTMKKCLDKMLDNCRNIREECENYA